MALLGVVDTQSVATMNVANAVDWPALRGQLAMVEGLEWVTQADTDRVMRESGTDRPSVSDLGTCLALGRAWNVDFLLQVTVVPRDEAPGVLAVLLDAREGGVLGYLFLPGTVSGGSSWHSVIRDWLGETMGGSGAQSPPGVIAVEPFLNLGTEANRPDPGEALRRRWTDQWSDGAWRVMDARPWMSLLQELRRTLRWAGLSARYEGAKGTVTWWVGGFDQALTGNVDRARTVMRVERLGWEPEVLAWEGGVKEQFLLEMSEAVIRRVEGPVVRGTGGQGVSEALTKRGWEEAGIGFVRQKGLLQAWVKPPIEAAFHGGREGQLRRAIQTLREAVAANPRDMEARLGLGMSLMDFAVGEAWEGQGELLRAAAGGTEPIWVHSALVQMMDRYLTILPEASQAIEKALLSEGVALETRHAANERAQISDLALPAELQPPLEEQWSRYVAWWKVQLDLEEISAGPTNKTSRLLTRFMEDHIRGLIRFWPRNTPLQREGIERTLNLLAGERPRWAPYLWSAQARLGAAEEDSVLWRRYAEMLDTCAITPRGMVDPRRFFEENLTLDLEVLAGVPRVDLALRLAELLRDNTVVRLGPDALRRVDFFAGWMHQARQEFALAAEAFDRMGSGEIQVRRMGPWGREGIFHGKQLAIQARRMLEGWTAPGELAPREKLVASIHRLRNLPFFGGDGGFVWILDEGRLLRRDAEDGSEERMVELGDRPYSCLTVGEAAVWIGTHGQGLLRVDKQSREVEVLGKEAGLPHDSILKLHADARRLWVAYGDAVVTNQTTYGMGYIDFEGGRFTLIEGKRPPEGEEAWRPEPHMELYSPRAPVRQVCSGFFPAGPEGIFSVHMETLYHYNVSNGVWSVMGLSNTVSSVGRNERFLVIGLMESSGRRGVTLGGGLVILDRRSGQRYSMTRSDGLPDGSIRCLALDGDRTWVGGDSYVARIQLPERRVEVVHQLVHTNAPIRRLELGANHLWIGVNYWGLALEETRSRLFQLPVN